MSISSPKKEAIDDRALALAERRIALEMDLLAAVLADPAALWPLAVAEGIAPAHFGQDDSRAMAEALAAHHESRRAALEAAAMSLAAAGCWDETVPAGTSAAVSRWWSSRRLICFSRQHLESSDIENLTASMAAALVDVAGRISRAEALADEYRKLVGEGVAA